MQQQAKHVIEIDKLSFRYHSGDQEYLALDQVDLYVQRGEFLAITGPSGSGKTTLMNLLGTLASAPGESLRISGSLVGNLDPLDLAYLRNRTIGFVFQHFFLLPRLSILENVMLPVSYVQPSPSPEAYSRYEERAMHLLAMLGIDDQANKLPQNLSGGQKQRVAIARALMLEPDIILADEPTGALDSKTSEEVLRILCDLNRQGSTVIIITHDPEVTKVAKRRVALKDGRVVLDEAQAGRDLPPILNEGKQATPPHVPAWRRHLATQFAAFSDAWRALVSAKLRTILTSLGLVIGITSIIIMVTLGREAQDIILNIFNQAGADRIYLGLDYREVRTGKFQGYWEGMDVNNDLPSFQAAFRKYGRIVPLSGGSQEKMFAGGNQFDARLSPIYGIKDFEDEGLKIAEGRLPSPLEFKEGARVAVIGSDFADNMWPASYPGRRLANFPLGEQISIRSNYNTVLTVIGILKKRDTTFESKEANNNVYMPLSTANNYSGKKKVTWFAVVPNKGVSHRWMADATKNYLSMRTGMKYPFQSHVPEEVISRIMLFITVFQALTALIGGLCIIVGGIGIMNIMLVTITERIREIGLRKALGARPIDISRQFLLECTLLCLFSGLVGSAIGFLFCNFVGIVAHRLLPETVPAHVIFNPLAFSLGLATAAICGLSFGMMPALKAARLDPSEALRSEA